MLNLLRDWEKPLLVNGTLYPDGKVAYAALQKYEGDIEIELNPVKQSTSPKMANKGGWDVNVPEQIKHQPQAKLETKNEPVYRIKVRAYMTKNPPGFDFHQKWNDGQPMPLRVMAGTILEETKGMYRMQLHGKPETSTHCARCGRTLTHPVSLHYGIGPECGGHYHIGPELDIEEAKKRMEDITWEGWVIKKAIEEKEVVEDGKTAVLSN